MPLSSSLTDRGGRACRSLGACMELAFRTKKLRTLCQEHNEAVNEIGEPAAEVLRARIADLRAVTYLADLPVGRPDVVAGNPPKLQLVLRDGWSLWMAVNHQAAPRTEDGDLDLARVRRVRIEDIGK
jgi:proteic killer suppression protein